MSGQLSFIKEYETYCPQIKAYNDRNECMQIHVRFPIVMTDLSGSKKRIRYARVEKTEDGTQVAQARSEDRYGNQFEIVDVWSESKQGICIQRTVKAVKVEKETGIRLTTELCCLGERETYYGDYQFLIPGAYYNDNDTDQDGMRSLLVMYEETKEQEFLEGAVKAAKILVTWTYIWDVPYDENTLLGEHGFKTTGWAVCDAIPAGSYVDCSFFEVIPELMRVAELSEELILKRVAVTVVRGMQHGLSMPQDMYGYAMPGVQCEGYMNSLWLADTEYKEFSGAAAKNKGDDNDTCNGFVNGMALLALDYMNHH